MINLKLTEKQAKVVLYWLDFAETEAYSNYEFHKNQCKNKSNQFIESDRKERAFWKYHTQALPSVFCKLHDLLNGSK